MTIEPRRLALAGTVVAAVLIALGVGLSTRDSGARSTGEADQVRRIVEISRRPWESGCELDVCRIQIVREVPFTTPAEAQRIDLVLRVGLTYRTSPGDRAVASVTLKTEKPPWPGLAPGGLSLGSAPESTTTTLTWARRNLPAEGRRYSLLLTVASTRGKSGQGRAAAKVSGAKTVLVAEMSW